MQEMAVPECPRRLAKRTDSEVFIGKRFRLPLGF
jgi:hypothetical protein